MTKKFSLLQLFSILDGRLSTNMDDVYDIMNHICNESLMTHHLPVAFEYLKLKNPKWLQAGIVKLEAIRAKLNSNTFETLIGHIKDNPEDIDVPQLKDEFDTSDFGIYMVDNSLLLKRLAQ